MAGLLCNRILQCCLAPEYRAIRKHARQRSWKTWVRNSRPDPWRYRIEEAEDHDWCILLPLVSEKKFLSTVHDQARNSVAHCLDLSINLSSFLRLLEISSRFSPLIPNWVATTNAVSCAKCSFIMSTKASKAYCVTLLNMCHWTVKGAISVSLSSSAKFYPIGASWWILISGRLDIVVLDQNLHFKPPLQNSFPINFQLSKQPLMLQDYHIWANSLAERTNC